MRLVNMGEVNFDIVGWPEIHPVRAGIAIISRIWCRESSVERLYDQKFLYNWRACRLELSRYGLAEKGREAATPRPADRTRDNSGSRISTCAALTASCCSAGA